MQMGIIVIEYIYLSIRLCCKFDDATYSLIKLNNTASALNTIVEVNKIVFEVEAVLFSPISIYLF